jgi:uncharacterized protein
MFYCDVPPGIWQVVTESMIRIKAYRGERLRITGLRVYGHAHYCDNGHDIVCAAVSALAQTALLGMKKIYGAGVRHFIRRGLIEIRIPPSGVEDAPEGSFLLETIYEGLVAIAMKYPGYVKLQEVLPDIGKNSTTMRAGKA